MMVPSNFVRWRMPDGLAGLPGLRGLRGLGDQYGELTNPNNPCAPGLQYIGGSCFRSPGSQETQYGTVAVPVAGPDENLRVAERVYGAGVTCRTELVDVGPYSYEQNICRDARGNIVGSADLAAESAFVTASMRPQTFNPNSPGTLYRNTPVVTPSQVRAPSPPASPQNVGRGGAPASGAGSAAAGSAGGHSSGGSQAQSPRQQPNTVQGEQRQTDSGSKEEKPEETEDDSFSFGSPLVLAAALAGAYFLFGRGR